MTLNSRRRFALACLALFFVALFVQLYALRSNPPGFFLDESSIAYNAYAISQTGKDEHGEQWPLFFKAFGEYKNPVYIYLLAAVFRLTGPSIFAARALSASAGLVTLVLLGLLGAKISQDKIVGFAVASLALFTPWLFELSRLVLEVAIYPLAVVLLLLSVWNASRNEKWRATQICAIALSLALLTYSYSIGRLYAPLLAFGLIIFLSRTRVAGILLTWGAFLLTLVPLLIFNQRHPAALTERFKYLSYIKPESSAFQIAREFTVHFVKNLNPWRLFFSESSTVNELVHVPGPPAMLGVTALLIGVGLFLLFRNHVSRWWWFVIYGVLISVVPASLTTDNFHLLRLAPLPVFLLMLTIPTLCYFAKGKSRLNRFGLISVLVLTAWQGLIFQYLYQRSASSPQRLHTFDADYPGRILPSALTAAGAQPIYLADNSARPAYVQAYWYATLQRIPLNKFINLGFEQSPPEGAVVITTEEFCPRCQVLAQSEPYTTYLASGPIPALKPLSPAAMSAELTVESPPTQLRPGQPATIKVFVKNISDTPWTTGDRSGSRYRVSLGNHWLDLSGNIVTNDDGRSTLLTDLYPGQTTNVELTINAPRRTGEYQLELDLLQEGVSWFGLKGSRTWRGRIVVQ